MARTIAVQCDTALPYAPEWVQLMPLGHVGTRDGRRFVNDMPEAVLAVFESGGIDLPIDHEHQNDRPKLSGPVPAAGWIKELARRDDGIWGRVQWTDRARALIAAREYRFLSPSLLVEKATNRVVRIKGAGLVHNPALHITALASEETSMAPDTDILARLAEMLDLDEGADAETTLDALKAALKSTGKPDPRKYVPMEACKDAMAGRRDAKQGTTLREADPRVDMALRGGHLTPAARSWALELCQADPASFDSFIAASPAPYRHLTDRAGQAHISGAPPARDQRHNAGPEVALLCEQLGLTPDRFG